MKADELTDAGLDCAVAKCEGVAFVIHNGEPCTERALDPEGPAHYYDLARGKMWLALRYSTDWALGGPIIEREGIRIGRGNEAQPLHNTWEAEIFGGPNGSDSIAYAISETPLIAAMRAYVTSKLGEEVADE